MSSFNELFSSSRFDSEMAAEEGEEQQQHVVVGTHRDLGQTVETMLNLFVSNHYDRSQFFLSQVKKVLNCMIIQYTA